jgi:UDP-glucose 6-dehydrogenase
MREASSRIIIKTFTELGAIIKAYDPVAMKECENLLR